MVTRQKLLLIFTNSQRVWRQRTRGDYWVLNLDSGNLIKLGGDAKPSTLMFAKFSPDSTRVGYVRENNLYVEALAGNRIRRLTDDGSRTIINGTFDWVYEEELDLRDGWRWSPDGNHIAYWQLDSAGVRDFNLINNTDSLYPIITPIPYPKAGETNSASRIGIVEAIGRPKGERRSGSTCRAIRAITTSREWIGLKAPTKLSCSSSIACRTQISLCLATFAPASCGQY